MEPAVVLFRSCGLPAAAGATGRLALLLEAVRAVDRLVAARHERHLGLFAARCTRGGVHLARAAAVAIAAAIAVAVAVAAAARAAGLALLPARGAARRLVGKALLRVELLLAAGEDEIHPTVPTRDCFV